VRSANEVAGLDCKHKSGASIFVDPPHFASALAAVARSSVSLRPYHAVISESYLYLLEEAVQRLKRRLNVRSNVDRTLAHVDVDSQMVFEIQKTFISEGWPLLLPDSVTQSTTEVHSSSVNPRRVQT